MSHSNLIRNYFTQIQKILDEVTENELQNIARKLNETMQAGHSIFIFGNGGCSSLASHFCADLGKMMKLEKNENYRIISLNDNIPSITAWANDTGYENIFWRQLELFMKPGDLVLALSGSGNSANVIRAVEYARQSQNTVISLAGFDGGKLAPLSDICYHVKSRNMQVVEDAFGIALHAIFVALRDS